MVNIHAEHKHKILQRIPNITNQASTETETEPF